MGLIFLVHMWTFLVKIAYWLTFFLFLDRKGLKCHLSWSVLGFLGIFCVQIKQKRGLGALNHSPELIFCCPPLTGRGGIFCKCLNFFYEQVLCLMCILVQTSVFGSSDKFFSKLFCFWILCKPTSDSGIWFWLDKFKLKEGPETWFSGAFETDDFDWNLSKNAIFG